MKRLTYAPKVYIFIRSSNLGGKVFDVSSDVVSGSVTQNCGDISSAQFYLKNRYQKWIRDPSQNYKQIFLPMDMVTIWLQRIAGKPIQVFTGYLDSVPYYQAYSGDVQFEASCTLKKLAYTWFDPGLPFFQQWMMSTDGWTYDVSSGEALNPRYQTTGTPITEAGPGTGTTATLTDGGFAALLGRFMTEVAGWSYDDILISELPTDIPKIAAKLFQNVEQSTEKDLSNLSNFMAQVLGVPGWGGAAITPQVTSGGTALQPATTVATVGAIARAASSANVPPLLCIFAAYILSGLDAKYNISPILFSGNNWGYGLYALQPTSIGTSALGQNATGVLGSYASTIQGYTTDQLLDPTISTQVFCKLLNRNQGWSSTLARAGDLASMVDWIQDALGRDLPANVDQTQALTKAKQLAASSQVVVPSLSPSVAINPAMINGFSDPSVQSAMNDQEKEIANKFYANADPWVAALLLRAKTVSKNIYLGTLSNQTPPADSIVVRGTGSDLKALFNSLQGDTSIDQVQFQSAGTATGLSQGQISNLPSPLSGLSVNSIYIEQSQPPSAYVYGPPALSSTSTSTTATTTTAANTSTTGGATFPQLAAFSANAAFAANFSFPADYLLATNLTGDRALMNDTSCLDAVKQFCAASLREFRSLPDGRFLAFYPDYFGARRTAYWSISNLEIVDFGIQLNDEALATHVYVIGDTFDGDGTIDEFDEISTRGVATINQAFMLESFIEAYQPPVDAAGNFKSAPLGRLADSVSFLNHYGARPHSEEQPIIRNTTYEFLMAWQRFMQLWASQFATTASFTFQPEVMAGGLIAFPDHGIQMYCDTVTHSFDYTQAFTTTATLSSPSLLPGAQVDRTWKPGFALAGNVNTVGLASGSGS